MDLTKFIEPTILDNTDRKGNHKGDKEFQTKDLIYIDSVEDLKEDYDKIKLGDMLELPNVKDEIANGKQVTVVNKTTGDTIVADCELSDRTRNIIIAGGLLDYTKENS